MTIGHLIYPHRVRTRPGWNVIVLMVLLAALAPLSAQTGLVTPEHFEKKVRPLLKEYCLACHSTEKQKGDLDLERFKTLEEVLKHPKVWEGVVEQVSLGEMPPKEKPQPSPADRERLLGWANSALDEAAKARAGDPGPVMLRRLNNAEYNFTVRDLTGVPSLNPAREFPGDSAAGEGFMNTGNALVMSPTLLTKYLDAGKEIASHVVLLPDGFRFAPTTTRRDWTEETLAEIRSFYRSYTEVGGSETVTQQGMELDKSKGGRLPLEKYLAATLELRGNRGSGTNLASPNLAAPSATQIATLARTHGLSAKYLASLWDFLNSREPSLLLDPIRARWRTAAPAAAPALAADIAQWQKVLWKFSSVGHIGKVGGPKAWMEPVNPLGTQQEVRLKLTAPTHGNDITLYLVATDAGDGNANDFVLWQQPRLVVPGRPNLLLRDLREFTLAMTGRREKVFASTAKCLAAVAEAGAATQPIDTAELARRHEVEAEILAAWLDYLGVGPRTALKLDYFTKQIPQASNYDFVKGWGSSETPSLMANSSTQHVRIPGNLKAHGVVVHPSPKLNAAVGWSSPLAGTIRVEARVTHAHPECGNGVTWSLELRRGGTRQRLATGIAQGGKEVKAGPIENMAVQPGDLVSLLIGPRDGNHSCDLTDIELIVASGGNEGREWNLTRDVSHNVLAGNPHADRFGHEAIWHFYTEPVSGQETGPVIPAGSLLAQWQSTANPEKKSALADAVQALLVTGAPAVKESPDAKLYRELASLGGPLFAGARSAKTHQVREAQHQPATRNPEPGTPPASPAWSLDPGQFGKHPNGSAIDAASVCVQAPSILEVHLPAELVAGAEFVTTGVLEAGSGGEGSVQLQVLTTKPARTPALLPGDSTVQKSKGTWTDPDKPVSYSAPIIVLAGSPASQRIEAALDEFRRWFPAALCYTKIVPVDEVVTLTLYHREDEPLARLMLDDAGKAKLDRLWDEMHYISRDALTLVDAFEQLWQFATQDADPKVFEPMRKPINDRATAFRQRLIETEPRHLEAVVAFAEQAYRRPLSETETRELRGLYGRLREQELPHDDAIRLTLARVFTAPAFLYRLEKAAPGDAPGPVSDWELASRLSYFLWSSQPDAALREQAAAGRLHEPGVLAVQTRRMLHDPRVRRLATEFACAWLHIYDFDELGEKSERHFPTFTALRGAMYEETIRFFTDFFQNDGSVLDILDADHTFLNADLAKHYGIPEAAFQNGRREESSTPIRNPQSAIRNAPPAPGSNVTHEAGDWRRVEGVKQYSRGGILAQATTLARQSGASRTSPILRGNWLCEVLLGEKLPRPPKDVPRLPEDEATETLTVRELTEKHSTDPKCYGCHRRIDPYGYSLEGFDAIGRRRERDLGGRPIDTHAKAMDGVEFEGLEGLRHYLLTKRREAFVKQFSRKLLGYSLGRGVILSDGPLIAEMRAELKAHDYHITAAIETIIRSRQFREIRGKEMVSGE